MLLDHHGLVWFTVGLHLSDTATKGQKSHWLNEDTQRRTLSEPDNKCRFYFHILSFAHACILSISKATKENLNQIIFFSNRNKFVLFGFAYTPFKILFTSMGTIAWLIWSYTGELTRAHWIGGTVKCFVFMKGFQGQHMSQQAWNLSSRQQWFTSQYKNTA